MLDAARVPSALVVPPAAGSTPAAPESRDPREALAAAQDRLLAEPAVRSAGDGGDCPAVLAQDRLPEVRDVPGTFRVGYETAGNEASPGARKLIEIGPEEGGYRTRRWVTAPLAR
ncbi:hypothetical protein [Streptomyces sp. NPDC017940]|uniref:hypothetical protein n=1 Tax=Streptomyces sp. NPDC017940 TaxID=3365017 RepID=UPI00378AA83B